MALLSKDAILGADDRRWEDVEVPEWGGTVRLMGLSGSERNDYQASLVVVGSQGQVQRLNMKDQTARLLAKCLVNDAFDRLFTDAEVKQLGAKNGAVLDRLHKIAQRLSGLRKEDVEDAAGKSESSQSSGSTTG